MPVISNFIGPDAAPITKHHDLWNEAIPHDRESAAHTTHANTKSGFSYGDYFSAAQRFLSEDNYHSLLSAVSQILQQDISIDAIQSVDLHLLKHGQYYHPARLKVKVNDSSLLLALNVAVSAQGRKIIKGEFDTLKWLDQEFPISFLPKPYAFGQIAGLGQAPVKLFLGEWFADYHEFHLSLDSISDKTLTQPQVVIWDETKKILDNRQMLDVIRKASMILTFYYNPETFEQIFPWHHAAGDFVVKLKKDQISVKLITVRGYAPLILDEVSTEADQNPIEKIFEMLLLFLVQLSLRMRMDRLDGVGEMVFYPASCIPEIVKGFFQGLDLLASMRGYPQDFCDAARTYLCTLAPEELADYISVYTSRYLNTAGEKAVINPDQSEHVKALIQALSA